MSSSPEISVVIPTRNRWRLLSTTALPAALSQEDVDLEVVVVDDGSRDETPSRLAELESSEPRLRALRHDRSLGVAATRNTGLAAARGAWVAFLDDDDFWAPHKLATQLRVARLEDAQLVYAGAIAVNEQGRVLYTYYFPELGMLSEELSQAAVVPAGASNVLASTELVRRVGGFDARFLHLEDWDLWIRLVAVARVAAVPEVLVSVLFHSANKHSVHDQSAEVESLIAKHAELSPPRVLSVDRAGHARWVAGQHSRAGLHRRAAWLYLRGAVEHRSPGNLLRSADALLGKRPSAVLTRSRARMPAVPSAPPRWLARCPYFQTQV